MSSEALSLQQVGLRSPEGHTVLDGVDWRLRVGEVGVVVGPSGAGKSRLLRLLDRLQEATSGTVRVLGRAVADWPVPELRRQVGLVSQSPVLAAGSVRDNLELPTRLGLVPPSALEQRLAPALATACVPDAILERDTANLSGGERQRVAVARALLLEPRVLLLDEPTSALDPPTAADLLAALKTWLGAGERALVLATHRLGEVGVLGGRLLVLMDGRVEEEGPSAAVLEQPQSQRTRAFFAASSAGAATP